MSPELASTGITALDTALKGGFPRPANFLLIGTPLSVKREIGLLLLNGGLEKDEAIIPYGRGNLFTLDRVWL
jgi:KaiC/GvpD/RAD55 family RecA-like ATPase